MSDCLFCRILRGELPSTRVYEDDQVYAFEDIAPKAPVHDLIVPKKHIPTLNDVQPGDAALVSHIISTAVRIARDRGIHESGYRTVFNVNRGAGQTVFHLHIHVLGGGRLDWE